MHVLVTVGTTRFDALVNAVLSREALERWATKGVTRLTVQHGHSPLPSLEFLPSGLALDIFPFTPSLSPLVAACDAVVCHAGAGTLLEVLDAHKPCTVVVNPSLMDNHQAELAQALKDAQYVHLATPERVVESVMESGALLVPPPANATVVVHTLDRLLGHSVSFPPPL